jgi:leader peptidase (prepilin peptidase)/N-methyltransferase
VEEAMTEVILIIWLFLLGLVFGSFFNVVIYRLPRGGSLVKPGSHCTHCGHRLRAGELIPVLSYLWQRGACKACRGKIHWRYPAVELLTGVGFGLIGWTSPLWSELVVGLILFSLLVILAFIDLEHGVLPNKLTVPGVGVGLFVALIGWSIPFKESAGGAIVGFVIITLIVLISRGGMGMGDAKLLALIGAFLGWIAVLYVLFWASVLGSIGGILYLYVTKQGRNTRIPFGPSLAAAAVGYLLIL